MNDENVLAAVMAELERLGARQAVRASAHDGVVTLTGRVADDQRRRIIVQELLRLPQVAEVRDALELPPPGGDAREQLLTLLRRQDIDAAGLIIEAADGVIVLKGRAQSWFDRDAAERLAWTLPGVRQVANEVEIPPGAVDPELEPGTAALDPAQGPARRAPEDP